MAKSILTDRQHYLLQQIAEEKYLQEKFYLTGGTALAEFYLHHRYSEDLDFFSEEEVDIFPITTFLKSLRPSAKFRKIDFQQSFNRNLFFLYFPDEILKMKFTYFPFPRIEKNPLRNNITIDSLIDIATNKLFSIYQRTAARDYIDLFLICKTKKISIKRLIPLAKIKFDFHIDPLQLGTQFVKAEQAKDFPRMIKRINNQDWHQFYITEAKKLTREIFE